MAGSFDPFTIEHRYVAQNAAEIFEELYVLVSVNEDKNPMFSVEGRVELARLSLKDIPNIKVMSSDKLTFKVAKELGAARLVRGLRHTTEYESELRLATGNLLVGGISTIGVFPRTTSISSTDVRLLIRHREESWKNFVMPDAAAAIQEYLEATWKIEDSPSPFYEMFSQMVGIK